MIKKLHLILSRQFGLDLYRMVRGVIAVPGYFKDYIKIRTQFRGRVSLDPWLHDKSQSAGSNDHEYFWQDLFVAGLIYKKRPGYHADVGSRIDGFVAHIASFREIEVFDIRSISSSIPNITFIQADLMSIDSNSLNCRANKYDSISCLHALEHFGLGRYGDPLNVNGYKCGIINIAKLLKVGGTFYLSIPVGREQIVFNANWIYDPKTIIEVAASVGLKLQCLYEILPNSSPLELIVTEQAYSGLSLKQYTLCLFIFERY